MDNHKALIEAVMVAISNAERAAIGVGPLISVSQMLLNDADFIRPQAIAALNAVYEALKEPTPEMIITGDDAIDECVDFYDNAFGSGYTVEGRASRSTWQAMLSASALSSPLGEGEREPVDNKNSGGNV